MKLGKWIGDFNPMLGTLTSDFEHLSIHDGLC
jgi:hypothetical protein